MTPAQKSAYDNYPTWVGHLIAAVDALNAIPLQELLDANARMTLTGSRVNGSVEQVDPIALARQRRLIEKALAFRAAVAAPGAPAGGVRRGRIVTTDSGLGLTLGPVALGAHWRFEWPTLDRSGRPESRVVAKVELVLAGEDEQTLSGVVPDPADATLARVTRRTADLRIEFTGPAKVAAPAAVTVTRDARPVLFGREAWGIVDVRLDTFGGLYVALLRDPSYDLTDEPVEGGADV